MSGSGSSSGKGGSSGGANLTTREEGDAHGVDKLYQVVI